MVDSKSKNLHDQLRLAASPSYRLSMVAGTTFIGVGTTGSEVLLSLFDQVHAATDTRVPDTSRWATIDADKDPRKPHSLPHQSSIDFISTGVDGAGTVTSNGHALAVKSFPEIKKSMLAAMSSLSNANDLRFQPSKPPSTYQMLVIIAGSAGGTSGGTKDIVVSAGHMCAKHIGLSRFDVVLVTVGGDIPWRDVNRSSSADDIQRIQANYAESAMWRYNQMATQRVITLEIPGHADARQLGATRIAANIEFDWENDYVKRSTCEEVIAMMSVSLFHRFFTSVGCRRASRACDNVENGLTGQKHPLSNGVPTT